LTILADQAAGALERARLYQALAEREHRLGELVQRLLLAAEDERRQMAYEIHDGLEQLAAATQQHLEGFADANRTRNKQRRDDLAQALRLASDTVREARHVIAGLRPTVLDDFGLAPALAYEIQSLRAEGWDVDFRDALGQMRLETGFETALFRVAQEALANVRKHAHTRRVRVVLEQRADSVRLEVRDWGSGFRLHAAHAAAGPSERIGLAGMQERIALLSGRLSVQSRPGAGTRIRAEVPLRPRQIVDANP
jgi:signal transduction histidine kinase